MIYALPGSGAGQAVAPVASAARPATGTMAAAATAASAAPDARRGRDIFGHNCAACHGAHGEGGVGPKLMGVKARLDQAATVNWIENPSNKMPRLFPSTLNAQDVADVAAFVQGL